MKYTILFCFFLFHFYIGHAQQLALRGSIQDEQGAPLAGVTIRLEPDRHLVQSDQKGNFEIKKLYPGEYTLYASHTGFLAYHQAIGLTGKIPDRILIRMNRNPDQLNEVSVSTNTSQTSPDNLLNFQRSAMPVTVITRETIDRMGSRRLDEILKEQTGMAVVSDISGGARVTGIQMQGFGSEYIMVLIDGQPMTGRNSGNFDLSRISVTNIERIEIIKGANSCLFGSDALGGAINIVTRHGAVQPQAAASLLYGSLNILDATVEGETPFHHKRGSANLSANYYHSDGYNTDPGYIARGTTAPPYDDYSIQGRVRYRLSPKSVVGMSGRFALRQSYMEKKFEAQPGNSNTTGDRQDIADLNLSAYYNHDFSNGIRSMSRYYFTRYNSDMSVGWQHRNNAISSEIFTQMLHRFEQQFAYSVNERIKFTAGLGGSLEIMNTNSYKTGTDMLTGFSYLQTDYRITPSTAMMGGVRFDHHNNYGSRLNPSLGIQQLIIPTLTLKLSAGAGFKAPDFKHRYQVFVNPLSNYMVIGTEALAATLDQLQTAGEISEIRQYLYKQLAGNLQPEKSISFNTSLAFKPSDKLKMEAGIFYHDIRNQINSIQVATGTGNRQIFTYQNLPKAVNKGAELSFSWLPISGLEINGGYQYLIAKDQSVKDSILSGNYPWHKVRNNETGETRDAMPSDYWGIENRSRDMANLRIFYHFSKPDINCSFRVNYRGNYPFGDANNNHFIDKYDQFVDGFFLLNASVEKRLLKDHLSLRATVDNIMDYTDRLMPGQPGRIILVGVQYRFFRD